MDKKRGNLLWVVDGCIGLLALMIYNFFLYILRITNVGGLFGQIEKTMGYFCLNSFMSFGFDVGEIALGIVLVFGISFILGVRIGSIVRKKRIKL